MKSYPIEVGRTALSKCGRDEGRKFIIIEIIDDDFVYVADGKTHKVENPKKKRRKHIKALERRSEKIGDMISKGVKPENYMLRNELEESSIPDKEEK